MLSTTLGAEIGPKTAFSWQSPQEAMTSEQRGVGLIRITYARALQHPPGDVDINLPDAWIKINDKESFQV